MKVKTMFTRGLLLMLLAAVSTWGKAQTVNVPFLCIEKTNGEEVKVPITETSPKLYCSFSTNSEGQNYRIFMARSTNKTVVVPCLDIKQLTTRKFEVEKGDVNANGKIEISDARSVVNHLLDLKTDPFLTETADIDGNGKVDITDVTAIIELILKKKNARTVEEPVPSREMVRSAAIKDDYIGQPLKIKLASGDSLICELAVGFSPRYENGEVVWIYGDNEDYRLRNVKNILFITPEQSLAAARQALTEFYRAMDGDNWTKHDNWCTDKPLDEWYGVNTNGMAYVWSLTLTDNNLKGILPDNGVFTQMGPMAGIDLSNNKITGTIPKEWERNMTFEHLLATNNQISGELPEWLFQIPGFEKLDICGNKMTGAIPAGIVNLMDEKNALDISGNDFSGKVPDAVVNHPQFHIMWNFIIPQSGHLTLPTIPGFNLPVYDLSGNKFNTTDIYKNNIYTLIFNYESARGDFTDRLKAAYDTYKSKGFEVLGLMVDDAEKVNDYLYTNNISWLNLDPASFLEIIGVYYANLNYINLIDNEGNVVFSSIMDDKGTKEDIFGGSTRDQEVFNVLEEKFGEVSYTPYTSTDYSHDGEVMTLQRASVGNGVDIVFIGNCFTDKDMAPGGRYETKMREAMEQFFAYEPYTSLRNRFNVYAVKAVSPNSEMYEGCKQAITSDEKAFNYARNIPTLIPNRPLRVNIIYNAYNAGRSFTWMYEDHSYLAFMMDGVSRVLNHEGGGHGIGRLYDEYVEEAGSVASEEEKARYEREWSENGRGANIDAHADVSQTRWAHFAADDRYTAEGLGAYEGSNTYQYGFYRPTQNSMMRYNNAPFNAPSREAIYKYVMQESEGPDWTYDYETFVEFDAKGREEFAAAQSSGSRSTERTEKAEESVDKATLPLPPTIIKGTWQDAVKNPTKIVYRH